MKKMETLAQLLAWVGLVQLSLQVSGIGLGTVGGVLCVLFSLVVVVVVRLWVKSKIEDWLERDSDGNRMDADYVLLLSALLTGIVGLLVVLAEIVSDFGSLNYRLYFEELLLAFSGSCMLWEEFRLLRSDRHTRDRAKELLDEMEVKEREVEHKHNELTDRIDSMGPRIVEAVTAIFKNKNGSP